MLKTLYFTTCFLYVFSFIDAYKVEKTVHPMHPHECWDKEINVFYQFGSYNQRPGKCEMIRCYQDQSMDAVGCHSKELKSGCTASPKDFTKSYPDCCPRITCTPPPTPENNNNNNNNNHKSQLKTSQSHSQAQQTVTKG